MRWHPACGVISIAGPGFRLTEERMLTLGNSLLEVADELAASTSASGMLRSARTFR